MDTTNQPADRVIGHGARQEHNLSRRFNAVLKSAAAVLFTIAPIISFGLWIHTSYFNDPRSTRPLAAIAAPAQAPDLWNEPLVSVTFDDGWESVYSQASPVLAEHKIRSTQYILSGSFDDPRYLSKAQVKSLQAAGHDIQSHTVSHANLKQVDSRGLVHELASSRDSLTQLTGRPVTDFASPYNSHSPQNMATIKQYYRSHRNTEALITRMGDYDLNLAHKFDRYQIVAFSVEKTTTAQQIADYLAVAKQRKAWVVLVYHEVDDKSKSLYAVTPQNFKQQMAAVAASGVRSATMDEVLDVHEQRQP